MENASKALIMAAGILLAMIILGAFVYLYSQITQNAAAQENQKLMEQINEFNKPYESYQKKLLRGADVISVCNRANDNNIKEQEGYTSKRIGEVHIWITFINKETQDTKENLYWGEFQKNKAYDLTSYFVNLKNTNKDKFNKFVEQYFECTQINYDNVTGLVTEMYFKQVDSVKLLQN